MTPQTLARLAALLAQVRSLFLIRARVFLGTVAALIAITGTLVNAQLTENEKKKREANTKTGEEMKAVASPTPSEASESKAKPKPARRKGKRKGNRNADTGNRKEETEEGAASKKKTTAKKTSTPEPEQKQKSETEKQKADTEDSDEEKPTPKKRAVGRDAVEPSGAAKKTGPKKTPTPEPDAKRKADTEDSDEEEATPKKKTNAKKTPTPEPDGKRKAKTSESADEKSPPNPKRTEKAEQPSKTPAPVEKSPKATPEPVRAATPAPVARPTPVPSPPSPQSVLPSDITIEKSGLQKEQKLEPPPPTPTKRGFWPWNRQPANYRFLTSANIDAIRRAPVQSGRWKFIIVHNSGTRQGNAKAFDYYHRRIRRMKNGLAYHFVIGNGTSSRNGQIEIGDRWTRQIAGGHVHSDYLNNIGLGICLVGDFNRDQPTRAQLDACEELIQYLRERCGKSDGRSLMVRPHREVNPPRWSTDCPGDAFPYGWLGKLR